jgi:hypothetical protein
LPCTALVAEDGLLIFEWAVDTKTMILSRLRKIRLTLCMTSMASSLFLSAHATSAQVPPSGEKQKISEGRYVRLKDNLKVEGSEQNWIFWRLSGGGYELEDHFQLHTDPAAQLLSQMGGAKISPDLRKEMESKTAETDFVVRYGPDRRPLALTAHGKNLVDGKTIEMVKCEISAKEVRCHGRGQHAKLRGQGSLEFFYAFPFPMLLSRWLVSSPAESTYAPASKLAVLYYGDKLDLAQADRSFQSMADETLTIGDRQFQAHKAKVVFTYQDRKPLELTIWNGAPGVVYALEGGGPAGERMALVEYKKYSDF